MTSPIDQETVRHVARLARLRLDEDEVALFTQQLARVFEHFTELDKVDVAGVAPMAPTPVDVDGLRLDRPQTCPLAQAIVAGVPDRSGRLIRVPAVFEGGAT